MTVSYEQKTLPAPLPAPIGECHAEAQSQAGTQEALPRRALAHLLEMEFQTVSERHGYVVKMPGDTGDAVKDEVIRPDRMNGMIAHLRREKGRKLMFDWGMEKPKLYSGKPRSKNLDEWKAAKVEYRKAKKKVREGYGRAGF